MTWQAGLTKTTKTSSVLLWDWTGLHPVKTAVAKNAEEARERERKRKISRGASVGVVFWINRR